jgi:putative methyltransferase (TIGR04325 family)
MNTKKTIKEWMPPILYRSLSHLSRGGIQFEGNYSSWEEARSQCSGYDSEHILKKVLEATLKVKNGEAAFERDSVLFYEPEYVWPVLSGLLLAAAQNQGNLNVLDFGGALGSIYFQHNFFLQNLIDVKWNVIEQIHYVAAGKTYVEDNQLKFYCDINECNLQNNINVILLSSVLQYINTPFDIIRQLLACNASYLIIDRTSFSIKQNDQIVIQKVSPTIYSADYPMWIFSESHFNNYITKHWEPIASFVSPEGTKKTKSGIEITFKGFIFESKKC